MKLKVPFYKQSTPLNCGPVALQMVLAYFGETFDIKALEEKTGINEGKGISTLQIASASSKLGFKSEFYSKHIYFNKENLKLEFYQKYADKEIQSNKQVEEAKQNGVKLYEKSLVINKLLSFVTLDSVPIVLIDWNVVMGRKDKGYTGHFVPLVGYDNENVLIHNHGLRDTQEFMKIDRKLFDEARKAKGTDEDVVVIYRR